MNTGASTSSAVTTDMLEEPQRQDSALHPLIEARRAVLQDLADNPVRPSNNIPIPRAAAAPVDDYHLSPPTRVDSAHDTLAAARSAVRASVTGTHPSDSSAPSSSRGMSQWNDQASMAAQASNTSLGGLSAEPSSSAWGHGRVSSSAAAGDYGGESSNAPWGSSTAAAGYDALSGESSSAVAYGPPMKDNPSQTLEEARRLLAASLHAEPSSSGLSQAGEALTSIWAARYSTWLLIPLTPKGVVFSYLFFSLTSRLIHDDFSAMPLLEDLQSMNDNH